MEVLDGSTMRLFKNTPISVPPMIVSAVFADGESTMALRDGK